MKKSLRIAIMFVVFTAISGCAFGLLAQEVPPIVGGYKEASKTDREVVSAARFAIKSRKRRQRGSLSLISIERAETQVVAGINYRLCLKVKMKGKTQDVGAVVYENLRHKYSLSSWNAGGCHQQE